VEALLASEDYGKDLASVNNLLKKHQLLEADISAHEVSRAGQPVRQAEGQQLNSTGLGTARRFEKENGIWLSDMVVSEPL
jgi:hypothetical protein